MMSTPSEPNPPARKAEDFPKTNTIPEGWIMEAMMELYNPTPNGKAAVQEPEPVPMPATGGHNGKASGGAHSSYATANDGTPAVSESLFARQLEPFPTASDISGMWL